MPTLYVIDQSQKLPDFVAQQCPDLTTAQQETACRIIAKYNRRHIRNQLFTDECVTIPDDLEQQLSRRTPRAAGSAPQLSVFDGKVLNALLQQNSADEILAMSEIVETLPQNEDTLKAFAGGLLGASQTRGKGYIQALKTYNDSLVQWKNASKGARNNVKLKKVLPAHESLSTAYKSELRSMARNTPALRSTKRGMRALRSRERSIDLTNTADAQRLKQFLKIARVAAVGAIIIDTGLASQKVNHAHAAGGNAEKVAYEEYGALIGGLGAASVAVFAVGLVFVGPGLIILTMAGGVSALLGAEGGRLLGKLFYEQISAYEAAIPSERKKQLLSESALSAL